MLVPLRFRNRVRHLRKIENGKNEISQSAFQQLDL